VHYANDEVGAVMEEFEVGFDVVEVGFGEEAAGPEEGVVVGEEGEDEAEEE